MMTVMRRALVFSNRIEQGCSPMAAVTESCRELQGVVRHHKALQKNAQGHKEDRI